MKNRRKGTTVPAFPQKWAEDVVSKGKGWKAEESVQVER
jgi:hypothetical protein